MLTGKRLVYILVFVFIITFTVGFIVGGMTSCEKGVVEKEERPASLDTNQKKSNRQTDERTDQDKPSATETMPLTPDIRTLVPGTEWETPLYIIRGIDPYPKMLVLGGVHGDEPAAYSSGEAASQLRLQKGTLYVIPRFNVVAQRRGTREGAGDINRKFPGDITSTDPERRLCGEVSKLIREEGIKMVLTFHEAIGFLYDSPNPGQTLYYDWHEYKGVPLTGKANQIIGEVNEKIRSCPYGFQDKELYQIFVQPIEGSATYEMISELGVDYAYGCEVCKYNDPRRRVWFHLTVLTTWMAQEGFKVENWQQIENNIWNGYYTANMSRKSSCSEAAR